MASRGQIGAVIKVDGEQDFNRAIKNIQNTAKLLAADMKAVTSEFDKNDKSAKNLTAQNAVLSKQIENQKSLISQQTGLLNAQQQAFTQSAAKIENLKNRTAETDSEQEKLNAEIAMAQREYDRLNEQIVRSEISIRNSAASLNIMERELQDNTSSLRDVERGFNDAGQEIDETGNIVQNTGEEADKTVGKFGGMKKSAELAGAGIKAGMQAALGGVKLLTDGVVSGVKAINETTKIYAEFDDQMRGTAAVIGFTSEQVSRNSDEWTKLNNTVKDVGRLTKFSAQEAAEAANQMAMAGLSGMQIQSALMSVSQTAVASQTDLLRTAEVITNTMSAFGDISRSMSADDVKHYGDVLMAAATSANTNVDLLGESMKSVGPIAAALGMSFEDTTYAATLMATAGINGEQAGNMLKGSLINLLKPTEQMRGVMEQYGISLNANTEDVKKYEQELIKQEAAEREIEVSKLKLSSAQKKAISIRAQEIAQQNSLRITIESLRDKFGEMSEAEQGAAAAALFGKQNIAGMLTLLNVEAEKFDIIGEKIYSASEGMGAVQTAFEVTNDSLKGAQFSFESAVEGMQIEIGDLFTSFKQNNLGILSDSINNFTTVLQNANGDWKLIGEGVKKSIFRNSKSNCGTDSRYT